MKNIYSIKTLFVMAVMCILCITHQSIAQNSISVHVVQDADGAFNFTPMDTTVIPWGMRIRSLTGILDTSIFNALELSLGNLPNGTYTVTQSDSSQWVHLGIIRNDVRMRAAIVEDTVLLTGSDAKSIIFVNRFLAPDTVKYRTFTQQDFVLKPITLKPKKIKVPKGSPPQWYYPTPNAANIRDTIFKKGVSKAVPLYIGIPFIKKTEKDTAKKFGWLTITKGSTLQTLFLQTGDPGYFKFKKELKDPKRVKIDNGLVGELIMLKLNIMAYTTGVVAPDTDYYGVNYFGDLLNVESDISSIYHHMPLRDIAKYADSLLTYGWRLDTLHVVTDYNKLRSIIERANFAFRDTSNLLQDTLSYSPLRIKPTKSLANVPFLIRGYIPPPKTTNSFSTEKIANSYSLYQNYPNPFNPVTVIGYSLSVNSIVSLKVYDVLGREVATLLNSERMDEGEHEVTFDGSILASGVYFYKLDIDNGKFVQTRKLLLMK